MGKQYRFVYTMTPGEAVAALFAARADGFVARHRDGRVVLMMPRRVLGEAVHGQVAFRGRVMAAKDGAVLTGAFRVPALPFFLLLLAFCLMAPLGGAPAQSLVWFALGAGALHGVFLTALNALGARLFRKQNAAVLMLLGSLEARARAGAGCETE